MRQRKMSPSEMEAAAVPSSAAVAVVQVPQTIVNYRRMPYFVALKALSVVTRYSVGFVPSQGFVAQGQEKYAGCR